MGKRVRRKRLKTVERTEHHRAVEVWVDRFGMSALCTTCGGNFESVENGEYSRRAQELVAEFVLEELDHWYPNCTKV